MGPQQGQGRPEKDQWEHHTKQIPELHLWDGYDGDWCDVLVFFCHTGQPVYHDSYHPCRAFVYCIRGYHLGTGA